MRNRFNPPPGWDVPSEDWVPPPDWKPDPSWPPAPYGWNFWVTDTAEPKMQYPAPAGKRQRWGVLRTTVVVILCVVSGTVLLVVISPSDEDPTAPDALPTLTGPIDYESLEDQDWKQIAKDPDGHAEEAIIVYGVVTQFDAATGEELFLANVGNADMADTFEYPTNTVLTGSTSSLEDLVSDDEFRAEVRIVGSITYETQIEGTATAPQLNVDSIKVL